MGFVHWVKQLIEHPVGTAKEVYHRIAHGVATLFHVLSNLGHVVGKAWQKLGPALRHLAHDVERLADASYHRLKHLYDVVVPKAIRHAISEAGKYTARELKKAENLAAKALRDARTALTKAIHAVDAWAKSAYRTLSKIVGDIKKDVAGITKKVGHLLDRAANMAAWVFPALLKLLWPYAQRNAQRIAKFVLSHAATTILDGAETIEKVIADVL